MDSDAAIVQAAFKRAAELELLYGDLVPARAIEELFEHQGESLRLANRAQGIFKPAIMQEGAISIKTTISRDGSDNIYDDREVDDGYYHYSLQAGDPRGVNNKYLWQSMERKQPLIYFHAVAPAVYKAIWPCFVSNIFADDGYALISVGRQYEGEREFLEPSEIESRYAVRESKTRLHQASFREAVLNAYNRRCAITGLGVEKLLEAAHIIPDQEIGAMQQVSNGIALSRIHHKAYDSRLLGIDTDCRIHISERLLSSPPNEFLTNSLLAFNGAQLTPPANEKAAPNRDFLARNFEKFELFN